MRSEIKGEHSSLLEKAPEDSSLFLDLTRSLEEKELRNKCYGLNLSTVIINQERESDAAERTIKLIELSH